MYPSSLYRKGRIMGIENERAANGAGRVTYYNEAKQNIPEHSENIAMIHGGRNCPVSWDKHKKW